MRSFQWDARRLGMVAAIVLIGLGSPAWCAITSEPDKPVQQVTFDPNSNLDFSYGHAFQVGLTRDGTKLVQIGRADHDAAFEYAATLFDVATGSKVRELARIKDFQPRAAGISPDRSTLAVVREYSLEAKEKPEIDVLDLVRGKIKQKLEAKAWHLSFSRDNKLLLAGDSTGIQLFDVQQGRSLLTIPIDQHTYGLYSHATISPDGKTVAWLSGAKPRKVHFVDVATQKETSSIDVQREVFACGYSPDGGSFIASGSHDLVLYDAASNKERANFNVWPIGAQYVAFSANGSTLVYDVGGKFDGRDRCYAVFIDVAKAEPKGYLLLPNWQNRSFDLSADGSRFLTIESNGKAAVAMLFDTAKLQTVDMPTLVSIGDEPKHYIPGKKSGTKIASSGGDKPVNPRKGDKPVEPKNGEKPADPDKDEAAKAFLGKWRFHRDKWDEIWTVAYDDSKWTITGSYVRDGKQIATAQAHGANLNNDRLTFFRHFDGKPEKSLSSSGSIYQIEKTSTGLQVKLPGRKAVTKELTAEP